MEEQLFNMFVYCIGVKKENQQAAEAQRRAKRR